MSIVLQSTGGGSITINEPTTASNFTQTLPAATGTVMVSGNMPTFSYYQSSAQTLPTGTATKITFTSSEWDTTSGMVASSTFTPTVAGYYQITGSIEVSTVACGMLAYVYKNGSQFKKLTNLAPSSCSGVGGSVTVYCNGSTDYIEFYALITAGQALVANSAATYFQGILVRSA